MERPNRVRQLYGYMVCLIAVVTSLLCLSSMIGAAIDLSDPQAAAGAYGEPADSFDAYMASRQQYGGPAGNTRPDTASDATLRRRFEALQASRIAQQRFRSRKTLVTSGLLTVVAVVLFASHWRWVRRLTDEGRAPEPV
jgi:hypothetical protein